MRLHPAGTASTLHRCNRLRQRPESAADRNGFVLSRPTQGHLGSPGWDGTCFHSPQSRWHYQSFSHWQPLRGERGREDFFADAVGRQPVVIGIYRDLLLLNAVRPQVRDRLDAAQTVAQVVHVPFQFAVRPRVRFEGDQQRRGVAEIVVGHHGRDTRRQLHLERRQPVLDFRPYLVLVVHIVVQLDHHVTHAVLRRGGGLRTLHLLVGHQELFERLRQLLFDLLGRRPGIDAHDDALPDRVLGELLLGNARKGVDSEHEQAAHDQEGDAKIDDVF